MPNHFETTDPRGLKVVCTEERWQHIRDQRDDWEDDDNWEDDVIRAINNPRMICTDVANEDIDTYYCHPGVRAYYMKVYVRFTDGIGDVRTAHEISAAKKGERVKWLPPSNH